MSILGYFWEKEKKIPKKIYIKEIKYGKGEITDDAEIQVLSVDDKWYTIKNQDLFSIPEATIIT